MSDHPVNTLRFASTQTEEKSADKSLPLPGLLGGASRSGGGELDPLLAGVSVEKVYHLATPSRGGSDGQPLTLAEPEMLVVEAEDGTTLFIRSDALAEAVARVRPDAVIDGSVDFVKLRDPNAASRGVVDVLWKKASVLKLPEDGLIEEAKRRALGWAKEKLAGKLEDKAYDFASALGAKALMQVIESQLVGQPGLYHWHDRMLSISDFCGANDQRLHGMANGKPALVLIHGTGSYTVGSFDDLRAHADTWEKLQQKFPGGIFGYEHRTFSESPQENALALLKTLPDNARISLLTYSRGGLVGDLLCLGDVNSAAIDAYRIDPRGLTDAQGLEREALEERQRMHDILRLLRQKRITVERYVRVASPSRGTRLLSENMDVALSGFLNLMQKGGSAVVGAIAAAAGGPVAKQAAGSMASSCLGVVKRLILEIADKRIDPRLVPGIAAMRTDSPLCAFLARSDTGRNSNVQMAVVAGDTEFDGLGLDHMGRRIANLFCDWRMFDHNDNDLVVDTDSMYAGLGFRGDAWYVLDRDDTVTHFRYFVNPSTRNAMRIWLVEDKPCENSPFRPIATGQARTWASRDAQLVQRGGEARPKPVVILLPGIMGTHIEINRKNKNQPGSGERIWLNPLELAVGRLKKIRDPQDPNVTPEDLFENFYGNVAEHLSKTHTVIRCPYDWRRPLDECAKLLKEKIELAASQYPDQPIRLLAHSMGGLVTRAMMKAHPESWEAVVASGGSLVMLGTPNNGSHQTVHALLGKTSAVRMLAGLDQAHSLQEIVDIVAKFPGTMSLLPRPGFTDAGDGTALSTTRYYAPENWTTLKNANTDRWFGGGICGIPEKDKALGQANDFWNNLPTSLPDHADRISYVFGQSDKTPCGVKIVDNRVKLMFTSDGDGTVTWQSGKDQTGLRDDHCWYMPVEHTELLAAEEHFDAITELLTKGTTSQLGRLPARRGETTQSFVLEAEPPMVASDEELARAMLGGRGPRRHASANRRSVLKVGVRAGDLHFVDQPVLCGHYLGDAISGAEAALDKMLDGTLSERHRLDIYASEIGTSAIVLKAGNQAEKDRGSLKGAVIVGLGQYNGQLGTRQITETVRVAVLRYLLQRRDVTGVAREETIQLYSLLIGWNSTASLNVAESVSAITLGVLEANQQFHDSGIINRDNDVAVHELHFIELYRDAAITAAHAVLNLPGTLYADLKRLRSRIEPATEMEMGEGVQDRFDVDGDMGHWSRLIVTDADAADADCPSECYEVRCKSPIPPWAMRKLRDMADCHDNAGRPGNIEGGTAQPAASSNGDTDRYYPDRLKYVFLSARARAETTLLQRQPRLVEELIRRPLHNTAYDPILGYTLFQIMIPLDYKAVAREQARLLLVLDAYTANLPWELLQAENTPSARPLAVTVPMVRQLATSRYRPNVHNASTNSACIIAAPDTYGFDRRFQGADKSLPFLQGAVDEGKAIFASLTNAAWTQLTPPIEGKPALDTLNTLYERPWRVLAISGHGVFEAEGRDGNSYTGVVLSDGLLITAAEIGQMEVVPELVFLNCCHLGKISNPYSQPNRLAYSLSRELIEMGVRCVIAAGWAVDDDAACTFAGTFFKLMTDGETFGQAVFKSRQAVYEKHRGSNTWGAYQAYGDPGYRLHPPAQNGKNGDHEPIVALDELLSRLEDRRVWNKTNKAGKNPCILGESQWAGSLLSKCPPGWADRPEVLQALGALYADLGTEGFEPAHKAYLRAVQLEDKSGRVAARTIEQLANMEARHGYKLASGNKNASDTNKLEQGLELIETAIGRLNALGSAVHGNTTARNPERNAILGSAYKLKAAVQATRGENWPTVNESLAASALAYRESLADDPAQAPYNTLNWLPLAWFSGTLGDEPARAAELARRCGKTANLDFTSKKDFWSGVMSADAELTALLVSEKLGTEKSAEDLLKMYKEAVGTIPASAREWDSVTKQWQLLADFLLLRSTTNDKQQAETLKKLVTLHNAGEATPAKAATATPVESSAEKALAPTKKPRAKPATKPEQKSKRTRRTGEKA